MLTRFIRFLNSKHIGPGDSEKRSVMLQCFPFDTRNNDMFLFQNVLYLITVIVINVKPEYPQPSSLRVK